MRRSPLTNHPVLFVEGLKVRPSGVRVLRALPPPMDERQAYQPVLTIRQVSEWSGLSTHVVRARLSELRRRGLVSSGRRWIPLTASWGGTVRYGHCLTAEGVRRARVG